MKKLLRKNLINTVESKEISDAKSSWWNSSKTPLQKLTTSGASILWDRIIIRRRKLTIFIRTFTRLGDYRRVKTGRDYKPPLSVQEGILKIWNIIPCQFSKPKETTCSKNTKRLKKLPTKWSSNWLISWEIYNNSYILQSLIETASTRADKIRFIRARVTKMFWICRLKATKRITALVKICKMNKEISKRLITEGANKVRPTVSLHRCPGATIRIPDKQVDPAGQGRSWVISRSATNTI